MTTILLTSNFDNLPIGKVTLVNERVVKLLRKFPNYHIAFGYTIGDDGEYELIEASLIPNHNFKKEIEK